MLASRTVPLQPLSMKKLAPSRLLRTLRDERRQYGWRGLLKRRGWKFLLVIVVFYIVRDVILYVLIPLAIVVGLTK